MHEGKDIIVTMPHRK